MKNKFNESMYKSETYYDRDYTHSEYDTIIPSKKLQKVVKKIKEENLKLKEILLPSYHPCSSTCNFIFKDVRINGILRRSGLSKLLYELESYKNNLRYCKKEILKQELIVEKSIKYILSQYIICPKCKGRQGEQTGPNYWIDCRTCNGYGMIENPIEKL